MPKTPAERMADLIARRKAAGLSEVRGIWLPKEQHAILKDKGRALADKLRRSRKKAESFL